jgi:hypothetical protein
LQEIKILLVSVFRDYSIEVVNPRDDGMEDIKFNPGLTLSVAGGIEVKVRPRDLA